MYTKSSCFRPFFVYLFKTNYSCIQKVAVFGHFLFTSSTQITHVYKKAAVFGQFLYTSSRQITNVYKKQLFSAAFCIPLQDKLLMYTKSSCFRPLFVYLFKTNCSCIQKAAVFGHFLYTSSRQITHVYKKQLFSAAFCIPL